MLYYCGKYELHPARNAGKCFGLTPLQKEVEKKRNEIIEIEERHKKQFEKIITDKNSLQKTIKSIRSDLQK